MKLSLVLVLSTLLLTQAFAIPAIAPNVQQGGVSSTPSPTVSSSPSDTRPILPSSSEVDHLPEPSDASEEPDMPSPVSVATPADVAPTPGSAASIEESATPVTPSSLGVVVGDVPPVVLLAQAPQGAGPFLGKAGIETSDFRRLCLRCCRQTVDRHKNAIPLLRNCNTCSLNFSIRPPSSGSCSAGTPLGYFRAPAPCFYTRCHRLLLGASANCMCLK